MEGKITHFNNQKGIGFIKPLEGGKDVFFHISEAISRTSVEIGDQVVFEVSDGPKGAFAKNVQFCY